MPPGVGEAAQRIANEGGILGALLILALGIACVLLWLLLRARAEHERILKEVREDYERHRDEMLKQLDGQYEKRIEAQQELLKAIHDSTGILQVVSQLQTERNASTEKIAEGIRDNNAIARGNADMLRTIQQMLAGIAQDARANGQAIERLVWHGGIARNAPGQVPGAGGGA